MDAASEGLVRIASTSDPAIEQWPVDAQTEGADDGAIRETLAGDYLAASLSEGVLTLRGDITLILYGPAYALTANGASSDERTGEYETGRTVVAAEGRQERHVLTLADAVLSLRAPEGVDVYTQFTQVYLDGSLRADSAEGALLVDGRALTPIDGALAFDGAATLSLTPASGRVLATAPDAGIATTGAIVGQGPNVALVSFALLVLAAAAPPALVIQRRRARSGDVMERALLAMEEHRWDDALPLLTRAAKLRPMDANVLVDRALCLEQTGRFDAAAKAFEAALRAAPRHAEAHFYYARTLAKMRETDAARVHLETALEHDPRLVEMARGERALRGL